MPGVRDDADGLAIIALSSAAIAALLAWIAAWSFEAPGIASWVVAVAAAGAAGIGIAALKAAYSLARVAWANRYNRSRR